MMQIAMFIHIRIADAIVHNLEKAWVDWRLFWAPKTVSRASSSVGNKISS